MNEKMASLTCEELYEIEEREIKPTLIDIREQSAWDAGHIDWAEHVPLTKLEAEVEQLYPNKEDDILLCCATDDRSSKAAEKLEQMGYKNVKFLSGGYSGYCGGIDKS